MDNLTNLLNIADINQPCFYNLKTFILGDEDGAMGFTNDHRENYVLVKVNGELSLTFPPQDYTGDPDVVSRFNAYSKYVLELA